MSQLNYVEAARLIRLGRRAESRGKAMQGCVAALLVAIGRPLIHGFFLMLGVGIIHSDWIPSLPPIGYWFSVLLCVVFAGFIPSAPTTKASS